MKHPRPVRSRASAFFLTGVLVATGASAFAAPAYAEPALDASGVDFSFVDPSNVLEDAGNGDYFDYEGVATIDGVQIDARLTVVETFNGLGGSDFVFGSQNAVNMINDLKAAGDPPTEPLVQTGCYRAVLINDEPADTLMETNTPDDFLVGGQDLDYATAFGNGSPFLDGSRLGIADDAEEDDAVEDARIRTRLYPCGGLDFSQEPFVEYGHPSYVRFSIDFTTGDDRAPVFLSNLTLSAYDIDNEQYLRFFSPLPDSYRVSDVSLLEVCGPASVSESIDLCGDSEYAGSAAFLDETSEATLEFYGEDSSDDGEVDEWAAEAIYTEAVSSVTYQFGQRAANGRSVLEVGIETILPVDETTDAPELAETGPAVADVSLPAGIALVSLLFGALLIGRRSRLERR